MCAKRGKHGHVYIALVMMSVIVGCSSVIKTVDCASYPPSIQTSVRDVLTKETADQIIAHNLDVAATCPDF